MAQVLRLGSIIAWERRCTADEYACLGREHILREMGDRWFIFTEPASGNDDLYFHRSWTGYCTYRVRLTADGGGRRVTDVYVNRDPEQYTSRGDASDLALLVGLLIDGRLLGREPTLEPEDLLRQLRNAHTRSVER